MHFSSVYALWRQPALLPFVTVAIEGDPALNGVYVIFADNE
jgi:hypothetical protein